MNKCPKCGFYIKENYCVRCGYYEGESVSDIKRYDTTTNDLQLLLKDDYQSIIYHKKLWLLFILGPLYFCYFRFVLIGMILTFLEFAITCIIGIFYQGSNIIILCTFTFSRLLYVMFGNYLIIKLLYRKIDSIKLKNSLQYKEELFLYHPKSILMLVFSILFYIFILGLWIFIYRVIRGNI